MDERVLEIAREVREAGGRAIVVGGYVRDRERGVESKDYDVEVFGLSVDALQALLERHGEVTTIGRAFGVLHVKGLPVDWSLPRRDSKIAAGHKGFVIDCDPTLSFEEAARRRDLTINSMGLDPLTGDIHDPHGGRDDLHRGVLRATDPTHFGEDPLRGVRVAQFMARLEMQPDDELRQLCRGLDLSELSPERLFEEMRKLLLKGVRPSLGLEFLRETTLLRFFPELAAMVGVPQDAVWHPEGDVWVHTMLVLDEAAKLRRGDEEDLALMLGALCHDLGKPSTTFEEDGRIRSPRHDVEGVPIAGRLLGRLRAPHDLTTQVGLLVEHHLAPANFRKGHAKPKAYRRLARKLGRADVSLELLERVARADHFGRTTEDARARYFPAGDAFLEQAKDLAVERTGPRDVVLGRHLLELGREPGPGFGPILERCREIQDETGWTEPDRILAQARDEGLLD